MTAGVLEFLILLVGGIILAMAVMAEMQPLFYAGQQWWIKNGWKERVVALWMGGLVTWAFFAWLVR